MRIETDRKGKVEVHLRLRGASYENNSPYVLELKGQRSMSHTPGPSFPRAVRIELRQPVLTQCDRGVQEVAHPSGRI